MCQVSRLLNEWFVGTGGGVVFFLGCTISDETCNFPTKILTKFLRDLSYKFHQSRSNLNF